MKKQKFTAWVRFPLPTPKFPDGYTLVSQSCVDKMLGLKWYNWQATSQKIYVLAHTTDDHGHRRLQLLHRFLLGVTDSKIHVDHINGNGLDNRLENLRLCGPKQNNMNRRVVSKNPLSNGYKGLKIYPVGRYGQRNNRFLAVMKIDGIHYYITGSTKYTAEDCAWAYNQAAKKFQGEFAWLNKLPKGYRPSAKLRATVKKRLQVIEEKVNARKGTVIFLPNKEAA